MNYLAHAYLSFGNAEILLGNMISDFVKGNKQFDYPPVVQKGIALHRAIDEFTDSHIVTRQAKEVFRSSYRLYSGAFIDVVYDHFLAKNKAAFGDGGLYDFSLQTYDMLYEQVDLMPPAFRNMFYYMQQQNWLYGYRTELGIYQSFGGLVKRAAYLQDSSPAIDVFNRHYKFLNECFDAFWGDVKSFAYLKMKELLAEV